MKDIDDDVKKNTSESKSTGSAFSVLMSNASKTGAFSKTSKSEKKDSKSEKQVAKSESDEEKEEKQKKPAKGIHFVDNLLL